MALLLTFAIMAVGLTALFWGGGMLLQTWLYNVPASRLGLRAAIAGTGVAAFLAFWCWLDTKNPGRYSTLLDFSSYDTEDFDNVSAVRKVATREDGKWKLGEQETITPYAKRRGGVATADFLDAGNAPWNRSDADRITVALLIKEEGRAEPTRFNLKLDPATGGFPKTDLRFDEENGRRYIDVGNIGRVVRPRGSLFIVNVLLNAFLFAVFLAAIWLGLRFSFGHAFGMAFAFWLLLEMVALQVLLQQTRAAVPAVAPKAAAMRTDASRSPIFSALSPAGPAAR